MSESNRVEYKCELTDSFEKEVVAFLNYRDGGIIYIGIDNDGSVVGVANPDAVQLAIKDRIKNNIQPSVMGLFDIVNEQRRHKSVIRITIAGGQEKPYYLKKYGMMEKGCFIRVGSASEPMQQEIIDLLYSKRVRNTIGRMESTRLNLTFEQLKIYYEAQSLNLNANFMQSLELVTSEGKPNYAAYLLADENGVSIQVAKYADATRVNLIENRDFGCCSLIKATKNLLERLEIENTVYTKIGYPLRQKREMIHSTAMREAAINAIVHNDYANGASPKFEFFLDRLEITSAGGLPHGVTKEDFFNGYSSPRNKEIMRVFRDLEIVEQLGSGVPRILEQYGKDAFEIRPNFLRVIFRYTKPTAGARLESGLESGLELGLESKISKNILKALVSKPLSRSALAKTIGHEKVSGAINRAIKNLLSDRLVEYTIPEKPNSRLQKYRLTAKAEKTLRNEQ